MKGKSKRPTIRNHDWQSREADSATLTQAQRDELDGRIARHEQNPSEVISRGTGSSRGFQEAVRIELNV